MGRVLLALVSTLFLVTQVMAGAWTSNNFLYKPAIGARGDDEKAKFDSGLNRVDSRLANEKWLNDSPYSGDLGTAITAIGSAKTVLSIPAGNWPIAANLTVPANLTLKFVHGAVLTIATGKTLTINGPLDAGRHQIFAWNGTGKAVFGPGSVDKVYPQWWGATGLGVSDDSVFIQAAINSVMATPRVTADAVGYYPIPKVFLPSGIYRIETCLDATARPYLTLEGENTGFYPWYGTSLVGATGNRKAVIDITGSKGLCISKIGIGVASAGYSTIGIIMGYVSPASAQDGTVLSDVSVYMGNDMTANDGLGMIGIANVCGENINYHNIAIWSNLPLILSAYTDMSWITGGGANTFTLASEYVSIVTLSCGVHAFSGDIILHALGGNRPAIAMFNANTVDLGPAYLGGIGDAVGGTYRKAIFVKGCSTLSWRGHAEGFDALMEVPGALQTVNFNATFTPSSSCTEIIDVTPAGASGGVITNGRISLSLPPATTAKRFVASTATPPVGYLDNLVLQATGLAWADIASIGPDTNLLPFCRNVVIELFGGSKKYDGLGTWTPVIVGGTTAGTGTYTIQKGQYSVNGNLVTVTGQLAWTAHNGTGVLRISGLPYTATALSGYTSTGNLNPYELVYVKEHIYCIIGNSTAYIQLWERAAALGPASAINVVGSGNISFTLTYLKN